MPWRDPSGRFSALKALTLAALFAPGLVMAQDYASGMLGARPITAVIDASGRWAIRLLLVSLAITPSRQVLRLPRLVMLRRMVGVAAFCYAALHLGMDAADKMFDLGVVLAEIAQRTYLAIGAGALALLLALAATSTDGMIERMGGKRWQTLQRSAYAIAVLAVVHFFLSKTAAREPVVMAGLLLWLMGYRALSRYGGRNLATTRSALLLLSLGAAALTALGEAAYFGLFTGIPALLVLEADASFAAAPRPIWIVLGAGLLVTAIAVLRDLLQPPIARPLRS